MTQRVMVDIETLGLEPGAAILSIGAVEFRDGASGQNFYREIELESCQEAGLEIDAGTLKWWLSQDINLRALLAGGKPLQFVLEEFAEFYPDGAEIWANSPSFDCEILEAAYEAVGLSEPWSYHNERDVRTLRSLPCAVEIEHDGIEHHALDDAIHQAEIVSETLAQLHESGREKGAPE